MEARNFIGYIFNQWAEPTNLQTFVILYKIW